ncbi:hypothetical protein GQ53DRAFT_742905 [Thozetella sp. PMI_491]|nr:hypothetical protein GQ53DRAFT_742905 [Thozetella sp. PMI_491]
MPAAPLEQAAGTPVAHVWVCRTLSSLNLSLPQVQPTRVELLECTEKVCSPASATTRCRLAARPLICSPAQPLTAGFDDAECLLQNDRPQSLSASSLRLLQPMPLFATAPFPSIGGWLISTRDMMPPVSPPSWTKRRLRIVNPPSPNILARKTLGSRL